MRIIIYSILSAISAGWYYGDRRKRGSREVDHDCDGIAAVLVGVFFPLTMPFCLAFSYVRYRERGGNEK